MKWNEHIECTPFENPQVHEKCMESAHPGVVKIEGIMNHPKQNGWSKSLWAEHRYSGGYEEVQTAKYVATGSYKYSPMCLL